MQSLRVRKRSTYWGRKCTESTDHSIPRTWEGIVRRYRSQIQLDVVLEGNGGEQTQSQNSLLLVFYLAARRDRTLFLGIICLKPWTLSTWFQQCFFENAPQVTIKHSRATIQGMYKKTKPQATITKTTRNNKKNNNKQQEESRDRKQSWDV